MSPTLVAVSRAIAPHESLDSEIEEAREALEFWSRRAQRLPWYRRAARREAEAMALRWRARLVAAHCDRPGLRRLRPVAQAMLGRRRRPIRRTVRRYAMALAVTGLATLAVFTTAVALLLQAVGA
jgi:hypothetical protein